MVRRVGIRFLSRTCASGADLDNYDWMWAGEHPASYTLQFPAMLPDSALSQYRLTMRKARGRSHALCPPETHAQALL